MPDERSPRHFQDDSWVFEDLDGLVLERLLVHVDDAKGVPFLFFLKVRDRLWQRFFLQAGLGFWGEYCDDEIAEELGGAPVVDLGSDLGLVGLQLGTARCEPGPRILIELATGEVVIEPERPLDFDSPTTIRFVRRSAA